MGSLTGLPQSRSVPSNLAAGRRHRVSISGSASYQSHLSSLGHLHRVRTTSEQVSPSSVHPQKDYLHILEAGLAEPRPRVGRLCLLKQFVTDPGTFVLDDLRRIRGGHVWRLRTLVTLYCCFSVLFLTIKIHAFFLEALQVAPHHPQLASSLAYIHGKTSPLVNVSQSQRLSIAFRGLPPEARLDTYVVQANPGHQPSDLTACFWTEDARVEESLASAAAWPGPVSLVIVTTHAPGSTAHEHLLDRLTTAYAPPNTCAHVLRVPSVAGASSNVYLNMARFFARTARVILFPDGIPQSALSTSRIRARWLDKLPADTPHPVLLGGTTHRALLFSPRPLAPVVLPRDHPVWCTERSHPSGSRVLDWEDCLWKLWLESAGEAASMAVPWTTDRPTNTTAVSVPPFVMKHRLRWSSKYRSEACAFALKRPQAPGSLSRPDKRRMQWRKKFCKETVALGTLDMS